MVNISFDSSFSSAIKSREGDEFHSGEECFFVKRFFNAAAYDPLDNSLSANEVGTADNFNWFNMQRIVPVTHSNQRRQQENFALFPVLLLPFVCCRSFTKVCRGDYPECDAVCKAISHFAH